MCVVAKGETIAPCISFINPPGDNYYLFSFYPWSYTHFSFSRPNVIFGGDSLYVWALTISESCYKVYDQMLEQLRTDGGAYTPTPTSIKGNISGGVYGCFKVSAVSEKGILKGK